MYREIYSIRAYSHLSLILLNMSKMYHKLVKDLPIIPSVWRQTYRAVKISDQIRYFSAQGLNIE